MNFAGAACFYQKDADDTDAFGYSQDIFLA
jgi:hypothetical protein